MAWVRGVRGVLCDVDGTLLDGDQRIPGAAECVARLGRNGVSLRLLTNTTRRSRRATAAALGRAGIAVGPELIVAPSALACRLILESGRTRAVLLVADDVLEDLPGVEPVDEQPDWVVVGDLGCGFTWQRLNHAFRCLREGARLLALHRNPCWYAGEEQGLVLDAGAFVVALEYAAGVRAEELGKPSKAFYALALAEMGLSPEEVLVVGDDVSNDGRGGALAGCRTALVRTGKFDEEQLRGAGFRPDLVLDSIADLGDS